jgi:antibiotic biosynthesis monooxygenase (ABM) superfamily enzyme
LANHPRIFASCPRDNAVATSNSTKRAEFIERARFVECRNCVAYGDSFERRTLIRRRVNLARDHPISNAYKHGV